MPEHAHRIPKEVSHTDLLVAMAPLLELLGVEPFETHSPIVIDAESIYFTVVARRVGDRSSDPDGTTPCESGEFECPFEFSELAIPVRVKVAL